MHIRHGGIWCTCLRGSVNGWMQLRKRSRIPSHICLTDVCGYIRTYTGRFKKRLFFFLSVSRHQRYLWICKAAQLTVENAHRSMPSNEVMKMCESERQNRGREWQKQVTTRWNNKVEPLFRVARGHKVRKVRQVRWHLNHDDDVMTLAFCKIPVHTITDKPETLRRDYLSV